ncbi:MAG: ribonuclease H family protein [Saprospiraceae bacterium]|nr:ribonuclease H family protein [Saprospiraceae bacterium]
MKKPKQKFYVVWEGNTPGIYSQWEDCLLQVKAYNNAKYKAFENLEDAEDAFALGYSGKNYSESKLAQKKTSIKWADFVSSNSIAVDAACEGNPGKMEYRGVNPFTGEEIFHVGPLVNGTNNIGEFLAIVHALALFEKTNNTKAEIYTDSVTAISWVKRKKANTKLIHDSSNSDVFELLKRATLWLNNHSYSNPIIKWNTEQWGEIPADFGRK